MKRMKQALALVSVSALTVAGLSTAWAAQYGMAGCGLGSMSFDSNTKSSQTSAATTNGTFASQTFGITSGTSNCTAAGLVLASSEQEAFFEANFENLQRDMATGGGEYLAALTDLLLCADRVRPAINTFAQNHYEAVFPSGQTTAVQALYMFKIGLSQDVDVARACEKL